MRKWKKCTSGIETPCIDKLPAFWYSVVLRIPAIRKNRYYDFIEAL